MFKWGICLLSDSSTHAYYIHTWTFIFINREFGIIPSDMWTEHVLFIYINNAIDLTKHYQYDLIVTNTIQMFISKMNMSQVLSRQLENIIYKSIEK